MKTKYIVFDLDDTLFNEIDFLKSAFKNISAILGVEMLYEEMLENYYLKHDVFENLVLKFSEIKKSDLIKIYRNHKPILTLVPGANQLLDFVKRSNWKIGLVTDGRSITQRNKLQALNIEHFFDQIIVSEEFGFEKPNLKNFEIFNSPEIDSYVYIGDNTKKDFYAPNILGWDTICLLDNGMNIHPQDFNLDKKYLPKYKVKKLDDIISIISI